METKSNQTENGFDRFTGLRKITSDNGWITPAGVFYACTPQEHDLCAGFLLKNNIVHIKNILENNYKSAVVGEIDQLSPRTVLKEAGFALLSDGLMVESNLPEHLSMKQFELMERAKLTFSPESGRLEPSIYLEFQKRLQEEQRLKELGTNIDGDKGEQTVDYFIKNPNGVLDIYDYHRSDEIFDLLTSGYTSEIVINQIGKSKYKWRQLNIGSGNVFVEFIHHDHSEDGAYECYPSVEDIFTLVDRSAVDKFLLDISRDGRLKSIDGDLKVLDEEVVSQIHRDI
jgi:hypothetical protein